MAQTSVSYSAGEICPFPSPTSPAAEKYTVSRFIYNLGYKALSLLITILASVVMNRLLSRGPLGIGSVRVCVCVCACVFVCACICVRMRLSGVHT